MKILLYLVPLLGLDLSQTSGDQWLGPVHGHNVYSERNYHDRPYHYNNDDQEDHDNHDRPYQDQHHYIERPCHIHDVDCIRRFLANTFGCVPTYGPAPDAYDIEKLDMDVPHSNASISIKNAQLKGLNSGKIEEFYINKKTDTLVLEVEFKSLDVHSSKSIITYHRKGKEPIEKTDYSVIEFKNLSLTLVIKHIHDIRDASAHVYAYLSELKPPLKVGRGLEDIEGLTEKHMIWKVKIGLSAAEAMVKQAPAYMAAFLHSKICHFKYLQNLNL